MNEQYSQSKLSPKIFGYEEIEEQLLKNFHNNKLHHAILFSGPKGIGKASFASKLAGSIISASINNNPDLLLIKREIGSKQELKRDISVDSIRKISDFTNLTSASSKYRVIIIDAADEMNRNSANALLKILEEPPTNIFLFLISHNSATLPITIKSRCNIIKIKPLNYNNFKKSLNETKPEIEELQLQNLFVISGGSPALAMEFYLHNGVKLYEDLINIISDKSNSKIILLTEKIIGKEFPWTIFEQIISLYFNRLLKIISGIKIDNYIFESEIKNLLQQSQNQHDKIFNLHEKITKLLADTKNLNLDKKQTVINIFNLIYG